MDRKIPLRFSEVNWGPLSIIKDGGQFEGIVADYMAIIAELSGLEFQLVPSVSWEEVLNKYSDGELDIVPAISSDDKVGRPIAVSEPYATFPLVIVAHNNFGLIQKTSQLNGVKVAAGKAHTSYNFLKDNYPDIYLVGTSDVDEGLLLLADGKVDAFVGHLAVVVASIHRLGLDNLKVAGTTEYQFKHRIGVSPKYPEVLSIINKSLKCINADARRAIHQSWFDIYYEKPVDYSGVLHLLGFVVLLLILIVVWNRKLFKLNESLNTEVAQRRRMEKVHSILYEIALSVSKVSGIDEFYSIVQGQVNRLMFARNFYIASYDSKTDRLSFPYFSDETEQTPPDRALGNGLTDYVIRTGEPLFGDLATRNMLRAEGRYELMGNDSFIWLGVPFKHQGQVVGVMAVQTYDEENLLDEKDLEVLLFLSSYVGFALDRLYLLEKGREQTLALKESEERFRTLFEDSADAAVLLDGSIIFECNRAAYKLMGLSSKSEVIGSSQYDHSPDFQADGRSSKEMAKVYQQRAVDEGGVRFEWLFRKRNQIVFPVEVLITPITYKGRTIQHAVIRDITERKQAEEALIEREIKYRAFFNNASDAILLMDLDLNLISANPEAVAMFRCGSEDELLAYRPENLLPPMQPGGQSPKVLLEESVRTVLEAGGLDFEIVCRRSDGEEFYASVRARKMIIRGETLLQGTFTDITDKRRAKEDIERSVSLLTATIESSADGILAVDGYGRVVAWNARFSRMWNIAEHILKSGIVSDVFGYIVEQVNEGESAVQNLWDYSLESDVGQVDELVLKDGRIIERYSNPQRIGLDVVGRVWSFRDVTDRRLSEKKLRASYHRLNDIIEFLPDPTIVIDNEGVVVAWNKAVEDVSGVRKEDIIGKGDYEYSLPFYGTRKPILIDSALKNALELSTGRYESVEQKGGVLYGEVYTPRAFDGKGAYFWGVAGPLRDDSGKIVGAIECMRNITDRRQVEKELNRAKLAAEAATRAKSEFLANMSHEIRTPMNSILGFGYLMKGSELDSSQREYLDKMLSSADSLLSIIDDILDFSKIEAGKLVLEKVEFEPDHVLEKICNMVAVKAESKGIDFVLYVAPDVPDYLIGDPLRLEQVLTNLTNNAVKFTESGEVALIVSCVGNCTGQADIRFTVKDSGIGLSQDEISELFNSFTQADASTTRKYGGTGLGLAITRRLVELMGGTISVESQPGVGSSFHFTISLAAVDRGRPEVMPADGPEMKALVVGGNRLAREFIGVSLEDLGLRVAFENSAAGAVERLKSSAGRSRFDLLFIDCKITATSGLETVSQIRGIPGYGQVPIIMMIPVDADEAFRKEAAFRGVDGFLSKPVTRVSLYKSLANEFSSGGIGGIAEEERALMAVNHGEDDPVVLLVEDNELNQQVARKLLEGFGLKVDVAENGRRALEAVWSKAYNLILMDIQMPEMDGLTAARLIRADDRYRDLPILAMTAHAMPGDREKSLAAGMNEHLTKPINPEELQWYLEKYLSASGAVYIPLSENGDDVEQISLPDLPGIDFETGLKNIGGSREAYVRVLQGFKTDYGNFSAELQRLVSDSKVELAAVKLHSLKGVAGNIGANRLYELCRILESDLREKDKVNFEADFDLFASELEIISGGLERIGSPESGTVRDYVYDKEKSFKIINRLYAMLGEGDAESFYVLEELRKYFNLAQFAEQFDELTRYIDNFDFDEGRIVLGRIAAELGITLDKG